MFMQVDVTAMTVCKQALQPLQRSEQLHVVSELFTEFMRQHCRLQAVPPDFIELVECRTFTKQGGQTSFTL